MNERKRVIPVKVLLYTIGACVFLLVSMYLWKEIEVATRTRALEKQRDEVAAARSDFVAFCESLEDAR